MAFKVLYSELQPCVLVACECKPKEPFLLLIRSLNQIVRCGFCNSEYSIEAASYVAQDLAAKDQPASGLKIKCTPPLAAAPEDDQAPRH